MQILFLEKHLQKQAVEPGVAVPVDKSQVVAGHVAAKVGELDALPLARAASLAFQPPAKNLAADQFQPFELRERGVGTQVHYIPVHRQPYYRERYGDLELPGAQAWYDHCLSLPLYPGMADEDVERVAEALKAVLGL